MPLLDGCRERHLHTLIPMHQTNLPGLVAHAADEVEQILLISVGRIAFQGVDACADGIALAVQFYPAAAWTVFLDVAPRRAGGLVADEQDVVAGIPSMAFR